jgi:DNA-binding GntR family transcriptional regulator
MQATVGQLLKSTDRFARMQLAYTDGRERAEREHREIVTECRTGNVKKASRLLRQHILSAGDALVSLLRERQQANDLAKV